MRQPGIAARPLMRLAGWSFALWLRTLRVRVQWTDGSMKPLADVEEGNLLFAFSERDVLTILAGASGRRFITLVDDSSDGDWAAAAATATGCRCIRGSSLHGGLRALRGLIRALQEDEHPAAIAVDGPVGPAGHAQPGIAFCAALTGRSIVPLAAAASWRIDFPHAWAGHYLPLPWSRALVVAGEPLSVRRDASREEIDTVTRTITDRLRELRERALSGLGARTMPVEPTAA